MKVGILFETYCVNVLNVHVYINIYVCEYVLYVYIIKGNWEAVLPSYG